LDEQLGRLGNRLGEFVEWQVRPAVVKLFQARGIDVHEFYPEVSVQRGGEGLEIDLLAVPDEVARYAYRRGLFVLAQSGDQIVILNDAEFQPRAW
jgi:hypothetical protein